MRESSARRVLIVDDSPAFTEALRRLLTSEGFVVDVLHDADAVGGAVSQVAPDGAPLHVARPHARDRA